MTQWTQFVRDFRGELEPHLEWYYRRYVKHMEHLYFRHPWSKDDSELTFKEFLEALQKRCVVVDMITRDYSDLPDWFTFRIQNAEFTILGKPHALAIMYKSAGQRFPKALH